MVNIALQNIEKEMKVEKYLTKGRIQFLIHVVNVKKEENV